MGAALNEKRFQQGKERHASRTSQKRKKIKGLVNGQQIFPKSFRYC